MRRHLSGDRKMGQAMMEEEGGEMVGGEGVSSWSNE
jgi:hypothetical protein